MEGNEIMESYGEKLKDAFDNEVYPIIKLTLHEKSVAFFIIYFVNQTFLHNYEKRCKHIRYSF